MPLQSSMDLKIVLPEMHHTFKDVQLCCRQ